MQFIKSNLYITIIISLLAVKSIYAEPYKKMAKYISNKAQDKKIEKVAVIPFNSLDNKNSAEGEVIAEELIYKLVNYGKVRVVERSQVDKILKELQLNQTGTIDAKMAQTLGKGLDAQALVMGSYSELTNGDLKVNSKLVVTETFEIIGAIQVNVEKSNDNEVQSSRKKSRNDEVTNTDVALITGYMIPLRSLSIYDSSNLDLGTTKLSHSYNGLELKSRMPIIFRYISWSSRIFGSSFDFGYHGYEFKPQNFSVVSSVNNVPSVNSFAMSDALNYKFNIYFMQYSLLVRIPVSTIVYPYAGIGYKMSLHYLKYSGSGNQNVVLAPKNNSGVDFNFGGIGSADPLDNLAGYFTFLLGARVNIYENLSFFAEYARMKYGQTEYSYTDTSTTGYNDFYYSNSNATTSTRNITISYMDSHIIYVGILYGI